MAKYVNILIILLYVKNLLVRIKFFIKRHHSGNKPEDIINFLTCDDKCGQCRSAALRQTGKVVLMCSRIRHPFMNAQAGNTLLLYF